MSLSRYALRTAGFGALYLLATFAGSTLFWPAAVVGALWLVAQGRYGRRNLDVIALSVMAVLAPGPGDGLLHAFVQAVPQVVPAVLFAVLFDRWLPGFWLGHGDRFRRRGPAVGRLAGAAGLAGLTGAVLYKVVDTSLGFGDVGYALLRDTVCVLLAVLAVRAVRQMLSRHGGPGGDGPRGDGPRRPRLTVVK
ncbi:MAG: hypothetical protein SYR96_07760 [Actinomycetota bacterium]|nr:hypothetical protein [Actinomycetota bacterium]